MAKSQTNAKRTRATADDRSAGLVQPAFVAHEDIARRAYDLYLMRGCAHGHHIEDWLQAERELAATMLR